MRKIINQDKNKIFDMVSGSTFAIVPAIDKTGMLWGFNLFMNNNLLGTFGTQEAAQSELNNLLNSKDFIYEISVEDEDAPDTYDLAYEKYCEIA